MSLAPGFTVAVPRERPPFEPGETPVGDRPPHGVTVWPPELVGASPVVHLQGWRDAGRAGVNGTIANVSGTPTHTPWYGREWRYACNDHGVFTAEVLGVEGDLLEFRGPFQLDVDPSPDDPVRATATRVYPPRLSLEDGHVVAEATVDVWLTALGVWFGRAEMEAHYSLQVDPRSGGLALRELAGFESTYWGALGAMEGLDAVNREGLSHAVAEQLRAFPTVVIDAEGIYSFNRSVRVTSDGLELAGSVAAGDIDVSRYSVSSPGEGQVMDVTAAWRALGERRLRFEDLRLDHIRDLDDGLRAASEPELSFSADPREYRDLETLHDGTRGRVLAVAWPWGTVSKVVIEGATLGDAPSTVARWVTLDSAPEPVVELGGEWCKNNSRPPAEGADLYFADCRIDLLPDLTQPLAALPSLEIRGAPGTERAVRVVPWRPEYTWQDGVLRGVSRVGFRLELDTRLLPPLMWEVELEAVVTVQDIMGAVGATSRLFVARPQLDVKRARGTQPARREEGDREVIIAARRSP